MIPSIPDPLEYGVSLYHGFLPSELPIETLPDPHYSQWEVVVKNLQALILSKRLRGVVDNLPVLSTHSLQTLPEWRRAYCVLAFITHAYIWGDDRPAEVIPPSISIPLLAVCEFLEIPTVATYASTCLWNFKPLFDGEPLGSLENLSTILTFTGSLDESWFYLVSVAIEARGGPILAMLLDAMQAVRQNDRDRVTVNLQLCAERLDDLGTLLMRMYENCDPHVFYHRIRPFLAGSKNMAEAGLPNGVKFDDGTANARFVQLSGGSNAQSSLIQFFDIALGIEHRPTGERRGNESSSSDAEASSTTHNFINDMRNYMPGPHRRFLKRVEEVANIREFVQQNQADRALQIAYNASLTMLCALRDKHLQMVSRYVVIKSRESRSHSRSLSPRQAPPSTSAPPKRLNLAAAGNRRAAGENEQSHKKNLKGTGGTALMAFLKQARDETSEPAVGSWAKRLLTKSPSAELAHHLGGVDEHANGQIQIVGLAGTWSVDDSEGGICHW